MGRGRCARAAGSKSSRQRMLRKRRVSAIVTDASGTATALAVLFATCDVALLALMTSFAGGASVNAARRTWRIVLSGCRRSQVLRGTGARRRSQSAVVFCGDGAPREPGMSLRQRTIAWSTAVAFIVGSAAPVARAAYDASREYVETPAVAARYPDPQVEIDTPAFAPGKADFTSQAELEAFVDGLSRRARDLRVSIIGYSQERRAIPLLVFARPAAGAGGDVQKNGKPTVLIIGQQHGNEPAGGEAALALAAELAAGASILDRVNVLIVPRANPDGAFHFVRGLANGADVNRDHLLEGTPEGRALGRVFVDYQPDVVLDCHEFGVRTRWFEKFGGLQKADALIQYATVSNLAPALTTVAENMFRAPLIAALGAAGLSDSWYYASSYDMGDKVVSMGGVVPDTGRNISGLRNAVSFLIETRGVGIGRAHFKRRVATHLTAMRAFARAAAEHADALVAELRRIRASVAASAGQGDVAVVAAASSARHTIDLLDPDTGADKPVEVDWRDALAITVRLARPRPFGYVLAATESRAVARLRALGVT